MTSSGKEARPLIVNETAPMSRTRPYVLHNKQMESASLNGGSKVLVSQTKDNA